MKIHPDGTLEGTAEELAAYQSKVEANKMPLTIPNQLGQVSEPKAKIVPLLIDATVEQLIEELNKKSTLTQLHVNIPDDWEMNITGRKTQTLNGESIIFVYRK